MCLCSHQLIPCQGTFSLQAALCSKAHWVPWAGSSLLSTIPSGLLRHFCFDWRFQHTGLLLINKLLQYFTVWKELLLVFQADASRLCNGQADLGGINIYLLLNEMVGSVSCLTELFSVPSAFCWLLSNYVPFPVQSCSIMAQDGQEVAYGSPWKWWLITKMKGSWNL